MIDFNLENAFDWIEERLEKPYRIIDILPEQVPQDAKGQYFAVEKYFLQEPQIAEIRRKYLHLLLKINCFFDVLTCSCGGGQSEPESEDGDRWEVNPQPEKLAELVMNMGPADAVNVRIEPDGALAVLRGDDTYMTLYEPDGGLLELTERIAGAEGLFVWRPEN